MGLAATLGLFCLCIGLPKSVVRCLSGPPWGSCTCTACRGPSWATAAGAADAGEGGTNNADDGETGEVGGNGEVGETCPADDAPLTDTTPTAGPGEPEAGTTSPEVDHGEATAPKGRRRSKAKE